MGLLLSQSALLYQNELYAKRALKDSLLRGEAPLASHLLYPLVLPEDAAGRTMGLQAAAAWAARADLVAIYEDYGLSEGMIEAMAMAKRRGIPYARRTIGRNMQAQST